MTSVARPGGECWREEADVRGFPAVSESVSRDLPDTRGHRDIGISGPGHRSVSTPGTYSETQSGGNNPGKVLNCNPGHFDVRVTSYKMPAIRDLK